MTVFEPAGSGGSWLDEASESQGTFGSTTCNGPVATPPWLARVKARGVCVPRNMEPFRDAGTVASRGRRASTRTVIVRVAVAPSALLTRNTTGLWKIDGSSAVMMNLRFALPNPTSAFVSRLAVTARLGWFVTTVTLSAVNGTSLRLSR